jgi:hypothetical protein
MGFGQLILLGIDYDKLVVSQWKVCKNKVGENTKLLCMSL